MGRLRTMQRLGTGGTCEYVGPRTMAADRSRDGFCPENARVGSFLSESSKVTTLGFVIIAEHGTIQVETGPARPLCQLWPNHAKLRDRQLRLNGKRIQAGLQPMPQCGNGQDFGAGGIRTRQVRTGGSS